MSLESDSPLALRFEEAIQPSRFLEQLRTSAENQTRRELTSFGNDAFKMALASAKFVSDHRGMRVVFEGGVPAGAKLMRDITGKALPTLVDGRTGRIVKIARVASTSRKIASVSAGAALVIVEAAHMISGHDNAQRLKRVERVADALLHAHESELKSRLEATYRHCKELMRGDLNSLTEEDKRELHRQCPVLMELRARWRDDFRHRLGDIKPASAGWIHILTRRRAKGLKIDRQRKAKNAIEALQMVQLMHFSLMLQMSLAGVAGRMDAFQDATLADECRSWRDLMIFTSRRANEICGAGEIQEFKPFLDAIADLVDFWSPDRWQEERPVIDSDAQDTLGNESG